MDNIHRGVAVLIFDDVHLVDVAGPAEAFREAGNHGPFQYGLEYFSVTGAAVRAGCGLVLNPSVTWNGIEACDDLLVTGGDGIDRLLPHRALRALVSGWQEGHPEGRVLSVCSGALLLADTGILQGRHATTHWRRSREARKIDGQALWDFDRIFTCDGNVYCSAGVTAGIDLALHIISLDAGSRVASAVARELVVPMQRAGGQSQHSLLLDSKESASDRLQPLIDAITRKPGRNWTLDAMAQHVSLTPRTLSRRMNSELGVSPVKFVELVRLQLAAGLIEAGHGMDAVARRAGFGSGQRLGRAIRRNFDSTPAEMVRVLKSDYPDTPD